MVIANVGMPQNARALLVSPNVAPQHGLPPDRVLATPRSASIRRRSSPPLRARILTREFPGVETLQAPGGLVASVFANGYTAPLVVEVRGENLDELEQRVAGDRRRRADRPWHPRREGLARSSTTRSSTSTRIARRRGFVGVTLKDAAETTLEATLGNINTPGVWIDANNGQSYYVVTFYDGRARSPTRSSSAALPVRVSDEGRAVLLGALRRHPPRGSARSPSSATTSSAPRTCSMQTEGRDMGTAASDLEAALHARPAARRTSDWSLRRADRRSCGRRSRVSASRSGSP